MYHTIVGRPTFTDKDLKEKIITELRIANGERDYTNSEYLLLEQFEGEEIEIDDLVHTMIDKFNDLYDCKNLIDVLFEYFNIMFANDLLLLVEQVDLSSVFTLEDDFDELRLYHDSLDTREYILEDLEQLYDCSFQEKIEEVFTNDPYYIESIKNLWIETEYEHRDSSLNTESYGRWEVFQD